MYITTNISQANSPLQQRALVKTFNNLLGDILFYSDHSDYEDNKDSSDGSDIRGSSESIDCKDFIHYLRRLWKVFWTQVTVDRWQKEK